MKVTEKADENGLLLRQLNLLKHGAAYQKYPKAWIYVVEGKLCGREEGTLCRIYSKVVT